MENPQPPPQKPANAVPVAQQPAPPAIVAQIVLTRYSNGGFETKNVMDSDIVLRLGIADAFQTATRREWNLRMDQSDRMAIAAMQKQAQPQQEGQKQAPVRSLTAIADKAERKGRK